MLKTSMYIVIILLSLSVLSMQFGLADSQWVTKMNIIDKTPEDFYSQPDEINVNLSQTSVGVGASDNINLLPGGANSIATFSRWDKIKFLVSGYAIGYTAILYLLGIPILLIYLIASFFGIFQIYILYYVGIQLVQAIGALLRIF